jgi:hypothetical protein
VFVFDVSYVLVWIGGSLGRCWDVVVACYLFYGHPFLLSSVCDGECVHSFNEVVVCSHFVFQRVV